MMAEFRQAVPTEEFDYVFLKSFLRKYRKPRDKISRLIRSGDIIRVKKGLYIFGPRYARGPVSGELLANLIYGPSYISMEYALSFYGIIPERVGTVTSMTSKRKKFFTTPAGNFSYHYLHLSKYPVGITWYQTDPLRHILIAVKEKALADLVARQEKFSDMGELDIFLTENLRIEDEDIRSLSIGKIKKIAKNYADHNVTLLCDLMRTYK